MRAIINGIPLLSPRSGVGNYIYQNFKTLLSLTHQWDFFFHYGIQCNPHLRDRPIESYASAKSLIRRLGRAYPAYRTSLDLLFAFGQWRRKFDLYHETNYIPMRFNGPTVLTVFDLSFYLFPETHPSERIRYMDRYFYSRLHRASHYITISEAIKQEMVKYLSLSPEKITVTPLGVDNHFKPIVSHLLNETLSRYGLKPGSYVLYLGTLEPRKNITTLLRAYAALSSRLRERYPLVLAGGVGWLMEGLDVEIEKLGIRSTTIKIGYVPREDLPSLYSGAVVFVYPSLYEGFGLPPLEAMASGTPVITSNVSSLPEVVGDAGVQLHPGDVNRLSEEIESFLDDDQRRSFFRQKGLERAKQFTWEKCAAMTLDVYDRIIRSR
jgi:alpha-1,3-rhamnosyl/mannosyltransferase